jgi:hypothetical protein
MTRRRHSFARNKQDPTLLREINAMLKSGRTLHPSPAERAQIITRRHQLMMELLRLTVHDKAKESDEIEKLARQYGPDDLMLVNEIMRAQFNRGGGYLVDASEGYRQYRLGFARFGGARPFLSDTDLEELNGERAMLYAKREFKRESTPETRARETELDDLLQMDWQYWEDITPQNIPAPPADHPAPAQYPAPLDSILTWGWSLDPERIAREAPKWAAHERALEKIIFDETLRNGWPGEPASWAPWHALHLLGELGAFGSARRLADLYALPNDWLSDLLPTIWAKMGAPAEISLWDILDDSNCNPEARGLAAFGLLNLVQNKSIPRLPAIRALAERLQAGRTDNAIVNAYIIFVLEQLKAVETKDAVRAAFKKKLVDTRIMDENSVSFLND